MNRTKYLLEQEYPPVCPGTPQPALTRGLFRAYAGPQSALTGAMQYFYNSLLADLAGENEISELFSCISQVSLHHLRLLGQLILAYGGDPGLLSYTGGSKRFWTAESLYHWKDPVRMREDAAALTRARTDECRALAHALPDAANRAVLERILADLGHQLTLFQPGR